MAGVIASPTYGADNELTAEEQGDGWILLFNGRDLGGWKNNDGKPVARRSKTGRSTFTIPAATCSCTISRSTILCSSAT